MSSPPHIKHSFDGDIHLLTATADPRAALRRALAALAQHLARADPAHRPAQISADIKLRLADPLAPREHIYHVSVTDPAFDTDVFARARPRSAASAPPAPRPASAAPVDPDSPDALPHGPDASARRSDPGARRADSDARPAKRPVDSPPDHDHDVRPAKRPRPSPSPPHDPATLRDLALHREHMTSLLGAWKHEWTAQGGWLADHLRQLDASTHAHAAAITKKLDVVQEILGQSLNTVSANVLAELGNVAKLLPWLEQCRKLSADRSQAREEKWRTNSATFHDAARRERDAADRRLARALDHHRRLLLALARNAGLDVREWEAAPAADDDDRKSDATDAVRIDPDPKPRPDDASSTSPATAAPHPSREASLGAQLTAELNMEAERSVAPTTLD